MPAHEEMKSASSVRADDTGKKKKAGRGSTLSFFLRFLPAAVLIAASLVFVLYFAPRLIGKPAPTETSEPTTAEATVTADTTETGTADATATETADATAGTTSGATSVPVIIEPTDDTEARMADAEKAAIDVERRLIKELMFLGYYPEKLTDIDVIIGGETVKREVYVMHGKSGGTENKIFVGEIYGMARSLFYDAGINDASYERLEATVGEMFGISVDLHGGDASRNIVIVSYISQQGTFPNGCEAVSATMLIRHAGSDITAAEFVDKCLYKNELRIDGNILLGPDPNAAYSGDPTTEHGGIGCYAPVIMRALAKAMPDGYEAADLTGTTLPELCRTMIDCGIPVSVWGTLGMEETKSFIMWMSYDRERSYVYPSNEHCLVLVGYDDESYYFCDPYETRGVIAYPKGDCEARYDQLGMQAVAVVPVGE